MNFTAQDVEQAVHVLKEKYPDLQLNNNKSVGSTDTQRIVGQEYIRQAMKRSNYKNTIYEDCLFENVAFTDSSFYKTNFINSRLLGNSFACCKFTGCTIKSTDELIIKANNFSQSNFTKCSFQSCRFDSSGFLQTLFYNCDFSKICIQGSTLEGSCFTSCTFSEVDMGNVNVEFIELLNSKVTNLILPFYQFPYIIGIAEYIDCSTNTIFIRVGQRVIEMSEYVSQIDNLILFYEDKSEYFATCNLYIMQKNLPEAKDALLDGINEALSALDFRMIRHFCRLAQRHNLLDEVTIRRISNTVENHLSSEEIPPERLNDCIIHAGEIRQILLSGKNNRVTLNLHIRTNVCKKNVKGVTYINSLCNELNEALSQNDYGQDGFQLAMANHSPYEIIIDVICATGALATVAELIWNIIEHHTVAPKSENQEIPSEYQMVNRKLYNQYVDARIEQCKEQLLNLKSKYSERKMNQYIEEVTQKLKTDITELYDKDIMIFKKKNSSDEE